MKVSKKDIYLIIGFLGVLAFLCAFLWVYQPTMEKVDALKAESRSLEIEIADLQSKMDNKDTYVSKTQEMATEMDSILQMFPVELKEEDAIVLTLTEELLSPMIVTTLTMDETEPVDFELYTQESEEAEPVDFELYTQESEEAEPVDFELYTQESEEAEPVDTGETIQLGLYRNPVSMQFVSSYEALKRYVKTVALQTNRTKIVGITASYDEMTGLLTCVANLNMYFITGQEDKTYVQPDFSSVITGTDNPFGSITMPYEADVAGLAENVTGIHVDEEETEEDNGEDM